MSKNRFIPAERILGEVLEAYKERNDEVGMAEAYHTFGNMYNNEGLSTPQNLRHFQTRGTYEKRFELSKDYFEKALSLYKDQQDFMGISKSYFGIASVYGILKKNQKACEYLDKSLEAYNQGKEKDPNARLPILTDYKDSREMIAYFKKVAAC